MKATLRTLFGTLLVLGTMAVADASADTRIYVRIGPPAPVVETHYRGHRPHQVWAPGYYQWDRRQYVWVPGHWARVPRGYARWEPARWVHSRRGWHIVGGYWR